MEEKERYEYFFGTNTIKDNKTNQFYGCVVDLLNQQDKRIKELEKENQQLKQQLAITEKALELACDYLVSNGNEDDELYKLVQNIYDDDEYLATKINYFKTKAKEIINGYKQDD